MLALVGNQVASILLAFVSTREYTNPVSPEQTLGEFLRALRGDRWSLREIERRTDGVVSNAYLSQLEQGMRLEPGPKDLPALANVYEVPVQLLFEKAGYTDSPPLSEIDVAFRQIVADPTFQFGTRFKGELNEDSKRVIIELYEKATGKTLLKEELASGAEGGQDSPSAQS